MRDENLAALCEQCHLNYDREEHAETRRRNREARTAGALQLALPALAQLGGG